MIYGCFKKNCFRLLLFFCLLTVTTQSYLSAQDADTIPIPLYIDDVYSGEVSAAILPDDSVQIRPSELIAYLEDLMSEEAIETARKIFPASGWLDLRDMGGLGVRILFKFEDLTIHITIPPHLRRETIISFSGTRKEPAGTYAQQSSFSAFLNLPVWSRFRYETTALDFSVSPELGLNILGWVAEAKGGIQNTGSLFVLDYARVVKDFESIGYRLEIGDLTHPATGLSGVSSLLGASFRRNTQLDPAGLSPRNRGPYFKEIFLREPSRIKIYLNDRKIREKDYPSGSYIFKDFQLSRGVNKITIEWEDSEGPHSEDMVIPFSSNLLAAGEFDLAVAAGLPGRSIVLPAVTAYQYLGITDNFTFGITESFNIDTMELNIRPDFLLAANFGTLSLVPIWGMYFGGGQKADISLGYQMLNTSKENYLNLGGGLSYYYDSMTAAENAVSKLSAEGYLNLQFAGDFTLTPELNYGYRLDEGRHLFGAKAVLKKSIRGGSSVIANIGVTYDQEVQFSASVSYSSAFPELNQNLYIIQNLENQKLSAFWNKYPAQDESDFSFNASAEFPILLDERLSFGLQGGYNHPLFSVSLGHDFDAIIETGDLYNATTLKAGSGLAFADGIFSITGNINDSFIIVAPEGPFADQRLLVNPSSGGADLELTGKPGVMTNIGSYTTHKVYVEAEELILGMDESTMKYLVRAGYKSGTVIIPEAEIKVYIGGLILNNEGEPVPYVIGSMSGETGEEVIDFFTDDRGYFEAYNLSQEVYTMRIQGSDENKTVDLSGAAGGFFDAGTISFTEIE